MAKEEEGLFDQIDLTNLDKVIDTSEFEKEIETVDSTEEVELTNEEKEEEKKDLENGVVDTKFFEKEKVNEEIEKENSVDDPSADSSSSPMQLFASTLHAEGLIDLEEDQVIESEKDLVKAWRKKMVDSEFDDLTDNQKTYLTAIRNGIPEEDIKQNFNNIKALEGVTEDNIKANEGLRKTLIAQDYIAKGLSEEKAMKLATRSVELGDDVEDATEALDSLKKIEGSRITSENERIAKQKKEDAEKETKRLSALKETILNKDEFIPNLKINSTTKNKIFKNMTEIVDYDEKGNPINAITAARLKDPENFEMMESMLYTITKGFTDWSKLVNTAKTSAVSKLEETLKSNQSGGGKPGSIPSSSGKGLMDAINNYKI
jgi:hypothetical protein